MIRIRCPHCREPVKAPDSLAGKKGRCPECRGVVPIPAEQLDTEGVSGTAKTSSEEEVGLTLSVPETLSDLQQSRDRRSLG